MKYESLNQQLQERVPALSEPRYRQLIGGIEAGPYVVFGVMFNQYLIDLSKEDDLEARSRAAMLIEDMAISEDERVPNMLISEVLPTLVQSQAMVDAYWSLLGTSTRRMLNLLSSRLTVNVEFPSSK